MTPAGDDPTAGPRTRQPELPPALVTSAQAVVGLLADSIGEQAAVTWVHAAAVTRHAASVALVPAGVGVEQGLAALAGVHPALTCWADPAVVPALVDPVRTRAEREVRDLWDAHETWTHNGGPPVAWWTYPLGDLYQALSTAARKGRALVQTPWWVTELLLHTSWDRAAEEWNPAGLRMIDPACGTGHILLEAHAAARRVHRSGPPIDRVAGAFAAVHGVDLDPYNVAVARYRLAVMALADLRSRGLPDGALADVPLQVEAADSLLADPPILARGRYHVVVANPPYIVAPAATRDAIRARYPDVCHRKFSLALPFFQLMTELAVPGGWVAQLTTNAWMKREYGKRFVEAYLAGLDLQWVIDTSGAYIPGHGTPTVILVHRNQPPSTPTVRAVLGKRGEPRTPAEPSRGVVWTEINRVVREWESRDWFARARARVRDERLDRIVALPAAPPPTVYRQPSLLDLLEAS